MSWRTIVKMALVTMGTIFVANQIAAINPTARKILKGGLLQPVGAGPVVVETPGVIRV